MRGGAAATPEAGSSRRLRTFEVALGGADRGGRPPYLVGSQGMARVSRLLEHAGEVLGRRGSDPETGQMQETDLLRRRPVKVGGQRFDADEQGRVESEDERPRVERRPEVAGGVPERALHRGLHLVGTEPE